MHRLIQPTRASLAMVWQVCSSTISASPLTVWGRGGGNGMSWYFGRIFDIEGRRLAMPKNGNPSRFTDLRAFTMIRSTTYGAAVLIVTFSSLVSLISLSTAQTIEGGVIFSERKAAEFGRTYSDLGPPYWTLDPKEVGSIRAVLKNYLQNASDSKAREIGVALDSYWLQFVAHSSGPNRRVFINGICRGIFLRETEYLRENLVEVFDGSGCFFHIYYDPKEDRFERFEINGRAG